MDLLIRFVGFTAALDLAMSGRLSFISFGDVSTVGLAELALRALDVAPRDVAGGSGSLTGAASFRRSVSLGGKAGGFWFESLGGFPLVREGAGPEASSVSLLAAVATRQPGSTDAALEPTVSFVFGTLGANSPTWSTDAALAPALSCDLGTFSAPSPTWSSDTALAPTFSCAFGNLDATSPTGCAEGCATEALADGCTNPLLWELAPRFSLTSETSEANGRPDALLFRAVVGLRSASGVVFFTGPAEGRTAAWLLRPLAPGMGSPEADHLLALTSGAFSAVGFGGGDGWRLRERSSRDSASESLAVSASTTTGALGVELFDRTLALGTLAGRLPAVVVPVGFSDAAGFSAAGIALAVVLGGGTV